MIQRSVLYRLYAASLLYDGAFYILLSVIPLKAVAMQASALQLGILPVLGAGVYVLAALVFGNLSDRFSRHRMALIGVIARTVATFALLTVDSFADLLIWMPVLGIANGLFWPGLQAWLGDVSAEGALGRTLGGFNVSWSAGKMLGFLIGGSMVEVWGSGPPLILAGIATAAVGPLLLGTRRTTDPAPDLQEETTETPDPAGTERSVPARAADRWRLVGWFSNFVMFGVGATLNFQYPKLLDALGFGGTEFGVFLAGVYFSQTVFFVVFLRWGGWHYRLLPLLLAQVAALLSVLALGWIQARWAIWALAPGIGLGLGISYASSIYYSLHRRAGKGRSAGIHEALLGTGSFALPFLAGLAVRATGLLLAPYVFCAIVLAGLVVLEIMILAGLRGRQPADVRKPGSP